MKEFSLEEKTIISRMLKEGKSHIEIAERLNVNSLEITLLANKWIQSNVLEDAFIGQDQIISDITNKSKILIGLDESGKVFWDPQKTANPHLMVVGESGFGKTYAITGIASELNRAGFTLFIIDYSSSYSIDKFPKSLRDNPKLKELNIGRYGIKLNPMEIRSQDVMGPVSVAVRMAGTFSRIYSELGVQQLALLKEVIIEVYERKGIVKDNPATWNLQTPYLQDIYYRLGEIKEDNENPRRTIAASLQAHISDFFMYNTFTSTGLEFHWREAIKNKEIIILQLRGLDGKTQKVITEFLLWDLYGYIASEGEKPLNCFTILDEAHNLSFAEDTPVDKILREARKFGLGIIIASQQPEDFSEIAFSNTETKICFQVSAERGNFFKKIAAKSKKTREEILTVLTTVPKEHAFVLTKNEGYICRIASHQERGL